MNAEQHPDQSLIQATIAVHEVASALRASRLPVHLQHASPALRASQTLTPHKLQYTIFD